MKISLVLEDIGAGPQIVFSSASPDEATRFYKTRTTPGKLALVVNPRLERYRKIKAEPVVVAAEPEPKRRRTSLL